jgi:alpha-glucosidase
MTTTSGERTEQEPREWWRTAVVYQVYVRSFADSNGDGIGDIAGITGKLAYLQQLGVQAIWLTPCYPSPQRDHGYDVADYFSIEPDYGTLDDFDALVDEARRRGIRVLMDIVPSHCSSDHEWFKAALAAPPGSPERERFFFRDGKGKGGNRPPNNWKAVFGGSVWARETRPDGSPGQWYLGTFTPWQPDFNWHNDDVVDHFDRMLRFWFDRGVEGFRIDAVSVTGKDPELPDMDPEPRDPADGGGWEFNPHTNFHPSAHAIWQHWRNVIDEYEAEHPERELFTVCEAYANERPDVFKKYLGGNEFHQCFAFDLMLAPWHAATYRAGVDQVQASLAEVGGLPTWTMNNHDMQRIVTRLGRANAADLESYTGNNLVYVDAAVDEALGAVRARAAIGFVAALPGCLYLYQGEELGLPEVLDLPADARQDPIFIRSEGREIGRDGCRVPLPWSADADHSYGFSVAGDGPPAAPWMPQPPGWGALAADAQSIDPQSMLWWYRSVFAARRHMTGPLTWLNSDDEDVLVFSRGELVVAANFGDQAVTLPPAVVGERGVLLSSSLVQHAPGRLPGDTCVWLR